MTIGAVEPLFAEVNDDLIKELERLLAKAKSGEITNMAYVAIRKDNTTQHNWSRSPKDNTGHDMMAGIAVLQHDYARSRLEIAKEVE